MAGQDNDAKSLINEALDLAAPINEHWGDAELYRMKGEISVNEGNDAAEGLYIRALEIARRQNAKSWELRAATSLAKFYREQGKRIAAVDFLAPNLRLVHRGLRHARFAGRQGSA